MYRYGCKHVFYVFFFRSHHYMVPSPTTGPMNSQLISAPGLIYNENQMTEWHIMNLREAMFMVKP